MGIIQRKQLQLMTGLVSRLLQLQFLRKNKSLQEPRILSPPQILGWKIYLRTSPITPVLEKPQKDVKCDIMSLFEKSNAVSPYAIHQRQLALLAQQQSLLMAAAAKTSGQPASSAANLQQQQLAILAQQQSLLMAVGAKASGQPPASSAAQLQQQQFALLAQQQSFLMAAATKASAQLQTFMQASNVAALQPSGGSPFTMASYFTVARGTTNNGFPASGLTNHQAAVTTTSTPSTQTGKDYDFS
ncbi:hypothetical protein MLD38_000655 [Melastoma candidum]|uniref:Uncharacterized protein n=1 Tax=Melastoma candidum TaxID=119954 RepID=A0ACB9SAU6_9MYRT|nr:hypothetical protein MLD38_000655 [Melastoma candidum]